MTDEEIEKALYNADDIAISEDVDCCDILDYINRLKEQIYQAEQKLSECEVGYQATLDLERRMRADDKEQIRKDTTKELLEILGQRIVDRGEFDSEDFAILRKVYGFGDEW